MLGPVGLSVTVETSRKWVRALKEAVVAKPTFPENPLTLVRVTVVVLEDPGPKVRVALNVARLKSATDTVNVAE